MSLAAEYPTQARSYRCRMVVSTSMTTLAPTRRSQAAVPEKDQSASDKLLPPSVNLYDDFERAVKLAKCSLKAGKLIALPTDTIYGIAGLAQSSFAVQKIYEVKERDLSKPVAICLSKADDVHKWAFADIPDGLLNALLPGPVTLVFRRRPELNAELNKGTSLIGIRVPDHPFMQRLAMACEEPLALTSANKSGGQSTLFVQEFKELWPYLNLVIDGGRSSELSEDVARLGSTVVDLSLLGTYKIVRDGSALQSTLETLMKFGLTDRGSR